MNEMGGASGPDTFSNLGVSKLCPGYTSLDLRPW